MKRIFFSLFVFFVGMAMLHAQSPIDKPSFLIFEMPTAKKETLLAGLDQLFTQLQEDKLSDDLLSPKLAKLTKSRLEKLQYIESKLDSTSVLSKQLMNLYPIGNNQYYLTIAANLTSKTTSPTLLYMFSLVAEESDGKIQFALPLHYLTRHWQTTQVGAVTYHHQGLLNKKRAKLFAKKNQDIAKKLGAKSEALDFYMCDHYQEIIQLQGFAYNLQENGYYRDGYGVNSNVIFSVMGNEDFSHDIFHFYSGKVNERKNRNWITEEGVAYSWGNAYYTDPNGEMISLNQLVKALNTYLEKKPDTKLYDLFENSPKLFPELAPEASIRSTIAGVIANEVEKQKGMDGIMKLINCGSKNRLESFLKATDELIGINKGNFNQKVLTLLQQYN